MVYSTNEPYARRGGLPSPEIDTFALSLCGAEEQAFVHGCNALLQGKEERALFEFRKAARCTREFMDAWFMAGFIELVNGRAENARQAFLRILQDERPFFGLHILRFMPRFRAHVNLFEDFVFHIMPTTAEVAAATARLYMIEERVKEAKKIIHPAFREYGDNTAVRVMWAQVMIEDDAPEAVIDEIDGSIQFHKGKTEMDLLLTYLVGRAFLDKGDFRSAVSHWESIFHHATGKNPRLIDRFSIFLAKAYESKGFLLDVYDILRKVKDSTMPYDPGVSVDFKLGQIVEKINTYRRQGIRIPLEFEGVHDFPRWKESEGYLELDGPGAAIP